MSLYLTSKLQININNREYKAAIARTGYISPHPNPCIPGFDNVTSTSKKQHPRASTFRLSILKDCDTVRN